MKIMTLVRLATQAIRDEVVTWPADRRAALAANLAAAPAEHCAALDSTGRCLVYAAIYFNITAQAPVNNHLPHPCDFGQGFGNELLAAGRNNRSDNKNTRSARRGG